MPRSRTSSARTLISSPAILSAPLSMGSAPPAARYGDLCCVRLKPGVFDEFAVERFYQTLAGKGTRVANGTWFGDEAREFRLGFGLLPMAELGEALAALAAALREAAQPVAQEATTKKARTANSNLQNRRRFPFANQRIRELPSFRLILRLVPPRGRERQMMSPHYSDYGGRSAVRLPRSCFAVDEIGLQHVAARPIAAGYTTHWPHPRGLSRFERREDWRAYHQ